MTDGHACPVCDAKGAIPLPEYEICSHCGFQLGYDDHRLAGGIPALRAAYIAAGSPAWVRPGPPRWLDGLPEP